MTNPLYDELFGKHKENADVFLYLENNETITFASFVARAAQFASVLRSYGVRAGDRVALQVEKSPDTLALCAACIQLGAIFLPLNPAYTSREVSYFVNDSGAKVFVATTKPEHAENQYDFSENVRIEMLNSDGTGSLCIAAKNSEEMSFVAPRSADDLAALLYTSGTTGRSKGAMLSQANLLSNTRTLVEIWQFTKQDCLLHALPIFHTHGLFVATNIALLTGCSMIFLPRFETSAVINAIPNATTIMGVPTFYTRLLADPKFTKNTTKNMRLFISGSAPLLAETHRAFTARTGHQILERYGMTETNMNTSNPYDGARKAGTVGVALPDVDVRIVDRTTNLPVKGDEIGTLEVKGPNVFQGYWNMPEKTAEETREDGFFVTGDLAQMDKEGYITIVGRSKDLIISGGFNVYPKEVEEAVDAHPDVDESAVVGVFHPDLGETVVAVVVGKSKKPIGLDTLQPFLATSLARYKIPREIIQIEKLPRNTMGKVQKAELRAKYSDIFR